VTWLYALRGGLVDETLDRSTAQDVTRRSLATSGVFLVSIGAAFLGLPAALLCWLVLIPAIRVLLARRHRHLAPT